MMMSGLLRSVGVRGAREGVLGGWSRWGAVSPSLLSARYMSEASGKESEKEKVEATGNSFEGLQEELKQTSEKLEKLKVFSVDCSSSQIFSSSFLHFTLLSVVGSSNLSRK